MRILVLANFGMGLYRFRKELLQALLEQGNEVYTALPCDEYKPLFERMGCTFIEVRVDRRGTNPITDFKLLMSYRHIIREIKPAVVLTYTIKPNVYGGLACRMTHTPYLANVTGLGSSIENAGFTQKISLLLYKIGLRRASCVFFQNNTNRQFFITKKIAVGKTIRIPGSGVNLDQHCLEIYPENDDSIILLFVGRIMKEKGVDELLESAIQIRHKHTEVLFWIVGDCEEAYTHKLEELQNDGVIEYFGQQADVHSFIKKSHATVLPSYHEGIANVLLESAASGRPVLASRVPGCVETFDEGISGIGYAAKSSSSLTDALLAFIALPYQQKREMGLAGRKKMEKEFSRDIVVNAYIEEINKIQANKEI